MNTSAPAAQPHHHAPRARWAQVLRWLAVCSAGAVCAVMVGCAVPGKEALGSARADVAVRLLLQHADMLMYQAKRTGTNLIVDSAHAQPRSP